MNPLLLKVPDQIETRRLLLRPPKLSDAGELNRLEQDSFRELHKWMPWGRTMPTLAATEEFCRQSAIDYEVRREFPMLLTLRDTRQIIGGCGLIRGDWTVPKFEVGYWLATAHTGCGYMIEAVNSLIGFARRHLKVWRLEIRTDARNRRSVRVAERAKFKLEGALRNDGRDNRGRLRDTLVFARTF